MIRSTMNGFRSSLFPPSLLLQKAPFSIPLQPKLSARATFNCAQIIEQNPTLSRAEFWESVSHAINQDIHSRFQDPKFFQDLAFVGFSVRAEKGLKEDPLCGFFISKTPIVAEDRFSEPACERVCKIFSTLISGIEENPFFKNNSYPQSITTSLYTAPLPDRPTR